MVRRLKEEIVECVDVEVSGIMPSTRLKPRKLVWMLPSRIIGGSICIVEGDTSVGKSTFLASLAASVTTGRAWLGRPGSAPARVLWVCGEEDFASMVRPRLIAANANLDLVHVPALDDDGEPIRIVLPAGLSVLRPAIELLGISLLIMEPLSSMVGAECDLNQVVSVRQALDPLNRLCIATGATACLTRGLRKDRHGPRSSHGQGSIAISDVARSVLCIDQPDRAKHGRILHTVKCSRSPHTPPLGYSIEDHGQGPVMSDIAELDATAENDADTMSDPGERSVREDARRLVRRMLSDGPVRSLAIRAAAEDAMISLNTLRRAFAELGGQTKQHWDGNTSYHEWSAPEGGFPALPPPTLASGYVGARVANNGKKASK